MNRSCAVYLFVLLFLSCRENEKDSPSKQIRPGQKGGQKIAEFRTIIKKDPVAEFRQKTDNPLNDWYFTVRLYETPKTFYYLIKLGFEEIRGQDTLKLPNFGIPPYPVIKKGQEKYSCIIGFLDKENKFREYKKVEVKNNALKISALRHYAVSGYK